MRKRGDNTECRKGGGRKRGDRVLISNGEIMRKTRVWKEWEKVGRGVKRDGEVNEGDLSRCEGRVSKDGGEEKIYTEWLVSYLIA